MDSDSFDSLECSILEPLLFYAILLFRKQTPLLFLAFCYSQSKYVKIFKTSTDAVMLEESYLSYLRLDSKLQVERGNAAYLSGLREKYFGELFSNASRTLEGLSRTESSSTIFSMDMPSDPDILLERNMSVTEEPLKHVARFIESFESESREIWLVYQNEGRSLSKLIYTAEETKLVTGNNNERVRHIQVLHPSKWWYWLRTTKAGQNQMQNLLRQLVCLH